VPNGDSGQIGANNMDASWITLATGLVAGLGIGSVTTALIQHQLRLKEAVRQSQRQDLKSRNDVLDELKAEWVNMFLFASKATLDALRRFILEPTADNLVRCATSMRLDLGRDRLEIQNFDLTLSPQT
jgi:hypothetical protein